MFGLYALLDKGFNLCYFSKKHFFYLQTIKIFSKCFSVMILWTASVLCPLIVGNFPT